MSNVSRLFYSMVSDPISLHLGWADHYSFPYESGTSAAEAEILKNLGSVADVLVELWGSPGDWEPETLKHVLNKLPENLREALDAIIQEETNSEQ